MYYHYDNHEALDEKLSAGRMLRGEKGAKSESREKGKKRKNVELTSGSSDNKSCNMSLSSQLFGASSALSD